MRADEIGLSACKASSIVSSNGCTVIDQFRRSTFCQPHERRPGEKRILTRREALSMIEIDHIIPEAIDVFGSIRTERAQRVPIDDIESVKKSGSSGPSVKN